MSTPDSYAKFIATLNAEILPFSLTSPASYQELLNQIGNARLVLMGEATHGTKEFYQARIELTKYLIQESGFHAVAIEGDWTSAYPVHCYLQGNSPIKDAYTALEDFKRFPAWMWRNQEMLAFIEWLRSYNDQANNKEKSVGFYGLDLYCLNSSIQAVINYLKINDPVAAKQAIQHYSCFDHCAINPQAYGYLVSSGLKENCIKEVTEQFLKMQQIAFKKKHQNFTEAENEFFANQSARVARNAELYYRALYEPKQLTWNIRDQHMVETLHNLISHLEDKLRLPAKLIIWAHNSHVGDARATEMSSRKEINLGQLVREQFGTASFLLGFSTYTGTVTAATDWDGEPETKGIQPGFAESYEELFHHLGHENFILNLHHNEQLNHLLKPTRLQRAIGVIYRPETERLSHYFFTHLPYQFDSLIHIDKTHALKPLD